ncbi:MAG: glycosyltransferase [Planctomycetota bacterium]|nr:glycosyltransferase [Planctomycetota bacterium]
MVLYDGNERPPVWFIAPHFGATSEVWMYRQATGMKRLRVFVLSGQQRNPEVYPPSGCELCVAPPTLYLPLVARIDWLRRIERWTRPIRNMQYGFFAGSTTERRWLVDRFRRDNPQVALCHYGTTAVRVYPVLRRLKIPLVVHINGFDLSLMLGRSDYVRQLKQAIPNIACFVVVAKYMSDWLVANGADPQRIRYIPYGVPLDEFLPSTHVNAMPCRFLAAANLVSKKSPLTTLAAFAKCRKACPQVRLTVLGDGPLRAECESLIDRLQLRACVAMLGAQSTSRVRAEMAQASVFLQHSVTDTDGNKEGWPVAIAEAAASGLPVVATRHASIPEQVVDGTSGILVDEGDVDAMAAAMVTLAEDPALRSRMGIAARSHISQWDSLRQIAHLENELLTVASLQHLS